MSKKNNFLIKVSKNGPYLISGGIPMFKQIIKINERGESIGWIMGEKYPGYEKYALCRCGRSKNHPYCDGTHIKIKFDGTETANRESYSAQAVEIEGPELILCDVKELCAFARFCDVGDKAWNLVKNSDDPEKKKLCIKEVNHCPSGRYTLIDKRTGKKILSESNLSIGLIEDTAENISGPIWVKGPIPIEAADGFKYEIRENYTLCRCGQSKNKPFCDGTHSSCHFSDKHSEK